MKTLTAHRSMAATTLAGLLLAGTACAGPQAGTQPSDTTPAATAATSEPMTATATPEPATATPATSDSTAATAPPSAATSVPGEVAPAPTAGMPQPDWIRTFTFPDGHISFSYPGGWTVRTEQGPDASDAVSAGSVYAVVADGAGSEVARILSGTHSDGNSGTVRRDVLDHAPVPGITDTAGKPVEFGFAVDVSDGGPDYFMDVRPADEFLPTQATSGSKQIVLPSGVLSAFVVFDREQGPVFATPEAAKAWMATLQYRQLKALLLSLRYA